MPIHDEVSFRPAVLRAIQRIPYGRVASYGDIAALVGRPRAARGVGRILRELPRGVDVPWWRVIASSGTITNPPPGGDLQRMLLFQEGIAVRRGGRVDMSRFRWRPQAAPSTE